MLLVRFSLQGVWEKMQKSMSEYFEKLVCCDGEE